MLSDLEYASLHSPLLNQQIPNFSFQSGKSFLKGVKCLATNYLRSFLNQLNETIIRKVIHVHFLHLE